MWRRRKSRKVGEPSWKDGAALQIANLLFNIQQRFVVCMERIFRPFSIKAKRLCFFTFCLASLGYSLFLFLGGILNSRWHHTAKLPDSIAVPPVVSQEGPDTPIPREQETKLRQAIERYRQLIDSQEQVTRKPPLDSIFIPDQMVRPYFK